MEDYSSNLQQQMQAHLKSSAGGSPELKEMSQATANLQQVAMANARQGQVVAQAIQQQQMQIQQLSQSVQQLLIQMRQQNTMGGAPMMPTAPLPQSAVLNSPPPPLMNASPSAMDRMRAAGSKAFDFGSFMIKDLSSQVGNFSRDYARQAANDAMDYARQLHKPPPTHNTGFAGEVGLGENEHGFLPMMRHSIGSFYSPERFKSMNYVAHQRAIQADLGQKASDLGYGALSFATSGGTAAGIGGARGAALGMSMGAALGPIGMIAGALGGSMLGGMAGQQLAPISPVDIFMEKIQQNAYYGAMSQQNASSFLRGRAGFQTGRFDMTEESRIGQGMRRGLLSELSLDNDDVSAFTQNASAAGMFLGVQNADQYVAQFKRQLSTAKAVMKIAGVAMSEATEIMASAQHVIGVSGGADTQRLMASVHSLAPLAGMGFSDMMGVAQGGAQSYAGQGMSAQLGARQAMASRALAGMGATFTMDRGLLASAGGEQGVAGVLSHTGNQFLQGAGGTMIGIMGSGYSNFGAGISGASGAMQTSGDMVSFMANRRSRTEKAVEGMGPMGLQMQQARDLMQLADEYEGIGGSKEDRMKILAKSQYGLNDAQAEALIASFMALPDAMKQQRNVSSRQLNDSLQEHVKERYSIKSQLKLGFRDFFEGDTEFGTSYGFGIGAAANAASDKLASMGQTVQYASRDVFDRFSGIERGYNNEERAQELAAIKDVSFLDRGAGVGPKSTMNRDHLREELDYINKNTSMGRIVKQAVEGGRGLSPQEQRERSEAVMFAIQNNRMFGSVEDMMSAYREEVYNQKSGKMGDELSDVERRNRVVKREGQSGLNTYHSNLYSDEDAFEFGMIMGFDSDAMSQMARDKGLSAPVKEQYFLSTEQTASQARDMFDGAKGEFVANLGHDDFFGETVQKGMRKLTSDLTASDTELEGALKSQKAQQALLLIKELYDDYDPTRITQSKAWEKKAKEAVALINQIEDPKSREFVNSTLKAAGVTITPGGLISFEGTVNALRSQLGGSLTGGSFISMPSVFEADYVDQKMSDPMVQKAVVDLSRGKSIEAIEASGNKVGAQFLREREQSADGLIFKEDFHARSKAGFLSKDQGDMRGFFDQVNQKERSVGAAEAAKRGLMLFNKRGAELGGLVDVETGTVDLGGIGQQFGSLDEDELNRMYSEGSVAERQVAMMVTQFQSGKANMTEADLGNKVMSLMANLGAQGGDVIKGGRAEGAMKDDKLAGSEAVRAMVTSMSTQTAINQGVLDEIKRMRGLS